MSSSSFVKDIPILQPYFITGFTDGEGSFVIKILKNPKLKTNWSVEARFQIKLHKKDIAILELIKNYFKGVGSISKAGKDGIQYQVASLQDLTNIVIPHFDKFPLITQKKADFILFKEIVELINRKEHLTIKGLQQIVAIKASINKGLSDDLKAAFPNITSIVRLTIKDQKILDPNWLAGFTSAEGFFGLIIYKSSSKVGESARLRFEIAQHNRDSELLKTFEKYLECGYVYKFWRCSCIPCYKIFWHNRKDYSLFP